VYFGVEERITVCKRISLRIRSRALLFSKYTIRVNEVLVLVVILMLHVLIQELTRVCRADDHRSFKINSTLHGRLQKVSYLFPKDFQQSLKLTIQKRSQGMRNL
jgi:hypothetical protein